MRDRRDCGTGVRGRALRAALAALVPRREPGEQVVVHHYTDRPGGELQLEVERRSGPLGIAFERVVLPDPGPADPPTPAGHVRLNPRWTVPLLPPASLPGVGRSSAAALPPGPVGGDCVAVGFPPLFSVYRWRPGRGDEPGGWAYLFSSHRP